MQTTKKATTTTTATWGNFSLHRSDSIAGGKVFPIISGQLTASKSEFLGDEDGNLVRLISQPGADQFALNFDAKQKLGEVVMRADGTKTTLIDLLDSILLGCAAEASEEIP